MNAFWRPETGHALACQTWTLRLRAERVRTHGPTGAARLAAGPGRARPGGFRLRLCLLGAETCSHGRTPLLAPAVVPLVRGDTFQDPPRAVGSAEPRVPGSCSCTRKPVVPVGVVRQARRRRDWPQPLETEPLRPHPAIRVTWVRALSVASPYHVHAARGDVGW